MILAGKREAGIVILQGQFGRHPRGIIGLLKHQDPSAAAREVFPTAGNGAVARLGDGVIGQRVAADDKQVELAERVGPQIGDGGKSNPEAVQQTGGGAFGIVKAGRHANRQGQTRGRHGGAGHGVGVNDVVRIAQLVLQIESAHRRRHGERNAILPLSGGGQGECPALPRVGSRAPAQVQIAREHAVVERMYSA